MIIVFQGTKEFQGMEELIRKVACNMPTMPTPSNL